MHATFGIIRDRPTLAWITYPGIISTTDMWDSQETKK
jgi:hypothetical protein